MPISIMTHYGVRQSLSRGALQRPWRENLVTWWLSRDCTRSKNQQLAFSRIENETSQETIMPRSYLPRLLSPPKVTNTFHLDATAKRGIAWTLGLKELPKSVVKSIDWAVNCYRATEPGSPSTTVANTLL